MAFVGVEKTFHIGKPIPDVKYITFMSQTDGEHWLGRRIVIDTHSDVLKIMQALYEVPTSLALTDKQLAKVSIVAPAHLKRETWYSIHAVQRWYTVAQHPNYAEYADDMTRMYGPKD